MGRAYQNRKDSMAKTSDAKAKVYSKYGREIYVVAKAGGVDPDGNLALRGLIDKAKKDQVPSHVIEKPLIAKGGGGGFEVARYEGFGQVVAGHYRLPTDNQPVPSRCASLFY